MESLGLFIIHIAAYCVAFSIVVSIIGGILMIIVNIGTVVAFPFTVISNAIKEYNEN